MPFGVPSALMIFGKLVQKRFLVVGQVRRRRCHYPYRRDSVGSQALSARFDREDMSRDASKLTGAPELIQRVKSKAQLQSCSLTEICQTAIDAPNAFARNFDAAAADPRLGVALGLLSSPSSFH
jgi:hypothetical protein